MIPPRCRFTSCAQLRSAKAWLRAADISDARTRAPCDACLRARGVYLPMGNRMQERERERERGRELKEFRAAPATFPASVAGMSAYRSIRGVSVKRFQDNDAMRVYRKLAVNSVPAANAAGSV